MLNDSKEPRVALHSAQKHRIVLDDTEGQPSQIQIFDGNEENYILIDTRNKRIVIESKTGDMLLKSKNLVRIEAKVVEISASDHVDTKASGTIGSKAGGNIELEAGSDLRIKSGGNAYVTSVSNVSVTSSSSMTVSSAGTLTIKGTTVNIN